MLTPRQVVLVVTVSAAVLFVFGLLCVSMEAQTSVNDVHISPRQGMAGSSMHLLNSTGLGVIKTDVHLVLVPVSVTDGRQRFVTGLTRDNFEVFEGKKAQTIQNFSSEDVPVSIGIILDTSGSMRDKWDRLRDAVNQFCDAANPEDEFFMVQFADEPRLTNDFTMSSEDLVRELIFAQPKGRTSLLDAIRMGLIKMKQAKYGKRALLIISDGGDNHSRYSERDIRSMAKEADVMIYSIGLFDRHMPTPEEVRGPSLLSEIAEPTGGQAFTLDTPNEMPAVARHIGMELRNQYVLGYRPQLAPHDGKWHKISVRLRLPKKFYFLQARARSGYYAAAR
jgi:Ca-activated chloride channel family protein